MMVEKLSAKDLAGFTLVGRLDLIGSGATDLLEGWILPRLSGNACHIVCGCIVIVVVKAIRIHKMRVLEPKLRHALIHHVHKSTDAARHMIGCHKTHLVGRLQHNTVQYLLDRKLLARHAVHGGASGLNAVRLCLGKRDNVTRRTVLQRQQRCHDLGDTRRIMLLVHVLGIKHGSRGELHHDRRCTA